MSGPDAFRFLQGQCAQDLRPLQQGPGAAVYGVWLTVKGKVAGDSFVLRGARAGEFWLGSYFTRGADLLARLEAFRIADEVELEDQTAAWTGVSFLGGVGGPPCGEGFGFRGRREQGGNREWVGPRAGGGPWVAEGREIFPAELEWRRIEAGIPAVPADAGPGDLPQEAGLEAEGVSFTKGCYLGQEVMARLQAMGQVRRRLRRVAGEGGVVPPAGSVLQGADDRVAGEVRSAVADPRGGWIGLAMLSLLHCPADGRLTLASAAPSPVSLRDPR